MREKRDIILSEIQSRKDSSIPSFTPLNLGSYALNTGVHYKSNEYDIDCGIRIAISKREINNYSAGLVKGSIYDAITGHREKKYRRKCITAIYFDEGKPAFHLDFPVFAYDATNGTYYLADGKQGDVKWVHQEPEKLIDYLKFTSNINDAFPAQYKRIVSFLKLWKDKVFSSKPADSCPPSVGLTVETRQYFDTMRNVNEDISILISCANRLLNLITVNGNSYQINKILPYSPTNDNIYYKMASDSKFVEVFKTMLVEFIDTLTQARTMQESSLENACRELRKVLPDFPMPEKEQAGRSFAPNASYGKQLCHMNKS